MDLQGRTSPILLTFLVGFSGLLGPLAQAAPDLSRVEIDHIEGSKLYFRAPQGIDKPQPLETGLDEISVITHLPVQASTDGSEPRLSGVGPQTVPSQAPWVLLLAKPCKNCSVDEKDLFVVRPSTGEIHEINHPGRILDPKTGALVHESRAFYGRCVEGRRPGVFVFQREKVDRKNHLASSFYSAEAGPHMLQESLLEKGFPSLARTLSRVKVGDCQEIAGRNRRISGRVFDLKASRMAIQGGDDPDEDDEDENDPNLRRATVGSEDGTPADTESSDDSTSETEVSSAASSLKASEGARVSSPRESEQELKHRITSPLGRSSSNSKRTAEAPRKL